MDADMAEEMRDHLERRTQANLAAGLAPVEARNAAHRQFGGVEQIKEIARDQRGWVWVEQLRQDLRYAARSLWKTPGFTTVVVLTLALGIGATTAIFSVVNAVILNPLPGAHADRVVQIGEYVYYGRDVTPSRTGMSPVVSETLLANAELFEDLAWADLDAGSFERKQEGFIASVSGLPVSPNFFRFFNAAPILGRTFAPDEAVPQDVRTRLPVRDCVIVLSYSGWQALFGGAPDVLGRSLELSGLRLTVIGVMPEWFQFPRRTQFWVPAEPRRVPPTMGTGANSRMVARLKPTTTEAQLKAVLDTLAQRLSNDADYGWQWKRTLAPSGLSLWFQPLAETLIDGTLDRNAGEIRRTLYGLFAAIGFVLLIGCANVANLLLARTERRQHELAVRAALGAGRARLIRQLLTESALLALLGGATGLLVTVWGLKLLIALNTLPRLRPVSIDGNTLGIAFGISVLTALAFGLAPAWRGAGPRLQSALVQAGAVVAGGRGGRRYRNVLVVVQVSLAVVLLSGAGLMISSITRMLRVNPGYDAANLISVIPQIPSQVLRGAAGPTAPLVLRNQFYENLRERLASVPGVEAVGLWKNGAFGELITFEGQSQPVEVFRGGTGVEAADYFQMARVPLRAGRWLEAGDLGEKTGTVVINETMARQCWPGETAVGKRFRTEGKTAEWLEVVGVVGDTRSYRYDEVTKPVFYRPYQESSLSGFPLWLVVRTTLEPTEVIPSLRRELSLAGLEMRSPSISVLQRALFDATRARRTFRNYLTVFAGVGLVLSALGIYGVLAYAVARRTREIGIRMAVGAQRRQVIAMVMGDGARLIGTGMLTGLLGAFWLMQLMKPQLFGVSPRDPAVAVAVTAVLSLVGVVACWLPARRAAQVDPMVALRSE